MTAGPGERPVALWHVGDAVRIDVRSVHSGLDWVAWRVGGEQPDTFLLAATGVAAPACLGFADVIVQPSEPTYLAAHDSGRTTLRLMPGCALVAVGVGRHGCLLRCRAGHEVFLPIADRRHCAIVGYVTLVLTGGLDPLSCGDSASR